MKRNQARPPVPTSPARILPPPSESEIQKEAYFLWIESGRPEGREVELWHAAKEILCHRQAKSPLLSVPHVPSDSATKP